MSSTETGPSKSDHQSLENGSLKKSSLTFTVATYESPVISAYLSLQKFSFSVFLMFWVWQMFVNWGTETRRTILNLETASRAFPRSDTLWHVVSWPGSQSANQRVEWGGATNQRRENDGASVDNRHYSLLRSLHTPTLTFPSRLFSCHHRSRFPSKMDYYQSISWILPDSELLGCL